MSSKEDKRKRRRVRNIQNLLLYSILIVIGIGIGVLFKTLYPSDVSNIYKQTRSGGNEYINPLIDFESVESTKIKTLVSLENTLEEYSQEKTKYPEETNISHISVYFKDLNSGAWIGINEDEEFSPASLLKLPLMITAYKLAENDPEFLNRSIVYTREDSFVDQITLPEQTLVEGQEYTLEELIRRLIVYSDNEALMSIEKILDYEDVVHVYSDLGLRNPYEYGMEDSLSVKGYATFFRILYNASYLNKEMSTKALKLLSETNYDKGITTGVPIDIKIADKFGEREFVDGLTYERKQLHDCGIVYYPEKPYILCVMTKGSDFNSLQKVLQDISKIVYKEVDK
jgi:beta-lactamase class A